MQIAARSFVSSSSHPRSRKEFFKVSNAALQSNIGWRWWSSSSAVSSNSLTPQQGRKRVPKQQRRAMILAFVEKYRALNSGKFPTATFAKKQLGGCYYVIRGIIQELEYNHKRVSPETEKEVKFTLQENDVPRNVAPSRYSNTSWKNRHVSPSASTSVEKAAGSKASAKLESKKGTLHTPAEEKKIGGKGLGSAANLQDSYGSERNQIRNQEVLRSDELDSNSEGQKDELRATSAKASSFWGNLKSMAAGIINLWKKT